METIGVITAVGHPERAAKKKKEAARPETRASSTKKVHLSKKQQKEEKKKQREYKEQVVAFQKIQDKVAEENAAAPEESEIPQLKIRSVATVDQDNQNFDAICAGDILDLKEEPRLVIDECSPI